MENPESRVSRLPHFSFVQSEGCLAVGEKTPGTFYLPLRLPINWNKTCEITRLCLAYSFCVLVFFLVIVGLDVAT
jgi:hypothetical protein